MREMQRISHVAAPNSPGWMGCRNAIRHRVRITSTFRSWARQGRAFIMGKTLQFTAFRDLWSDKNASRVQVIVTWSSITNELKAFEPAFCGAFESPQILRAS